MTKTLLFDLDNTLLDNSMETFVPAYLQALSQRMTQHADSKRLVQTLLRATQSMVDNEQPNRSLMEVFDEAFYPALGLEKARVEATIQAFYAEDFPRLQPLTQPRPEAVSLIEKAFQAGYQIGIATNPLFPRTAIQQRLAWAGLPVERYPFALVPCYETFHFAKPNPAYFAEFLAQMGWPEGAVLVIGDDPLNDIQPARQLGLPVFWIHPDASVEWPGQDMEPARGSLADVLTCLTSTDVEALRPECQGPQALLAILRATPAAMQTLCYVLPRELWDRRTQSDEWCPTEILCHLRDVESEVNLPRIEKILKESNPFLTGKDTDPWAQTRQYILQDGQQALLDFIKFRQELIQKLVDLPDEAWKRPARHAIFGPTTLQEMTRIISDHDRLHLRQFHQVTHI